MESSASQDALCRFCRNSTLICDFLEAKFHEAGPPPEFIDKDIESVSHFRECKTCPVCRLILKSVFMTPGAEEVSRERGMIVIAKEEFGRYNVPDEKGFSGRVDRLWVMLMLGADGYTRDIEGTVFARGIQLLSGSDCGITTHNSEDLLLGRRMPQSQIDIGRVQKWLEHCSQRHGSACTPSLLTKKFPMRHIDVRTECIVEAPSNAKYIALSYVWGSVEQRLKDGSLGIFLTQSTLESFTVPGSLNAGNEELPKTISDAMLFCRLLGVDYLWVDSLCIQQDSPQDKSAQIPQMHLIYGSAYLTIVAAAGESSWAGLPGVRQGSRDTVQHLETVNGVGLITAARPFIPSVAKSKWNTRGWTYEEKVLSPRLLIFTEYQIFFNCGQSLWYEDAVLEIEDHTIQMYDPPDSYTRSWLGERKVSANVSPWNQYKHAVLGYTGRHVTEKEDCHNAFLGVEATLRGKLGQRFVWSLPEVIFDYTLSWYWHNVPLLENRNPSAPSWSWVSWLGSMGPNVTAGVKDFSGDPRKARRLFLFFRHDPTALKLIHIDSELPGISSTTSDDSSLLSHSSNWHGSTDDNQEKPPIISAVPPLSHRLYVFTSNAFLRVDRHRYDSFDERLRSWTDGSRIPVDSTPSPWMINARRRDLLAPYQRESYEKLHYYRVRNDQDKAIGTLYLDPKWRAKQPHRLEFVAILGFVDPERVLAWVVQRKRNGEQEWVERVQQVMNPFEKKEWKRCRPVWKWVTLC